MSKITAQFGADISEFEAKGIAMQERAKKIDKALKSIDGPPKDVAGGFDKIGKSVKETEGALKGGAAALLLKEVGGRLLQAAENARKMRDELISAGKEVPILVSAAANIADSWSTSKKAVGDFVTNGLGKVQQGMEHVTALFVTGFDPEKASIVLAAKAADERLASAAASADKIRGKAGEVGKQADSQEKKNEEDSLNSLTLQYRREKELEEAKKKQIDLANESLKLTKEKIGLDSSTEAGSKRAAEIILRQANIEKEIQENRLVAAQKIAEVGKLRETNEKAFQDSKKKADDEDKKRLDELKKKNDEAAKEAKRIADEQQKLEQELGDLQYSRMLRYMTLEQKLALIIKEGREAQARADKDASAENLIALEKIRARYADLKKEIEGGKKDEKSDGRGADGKLRNKSGRIVSDEDRARSDAAKNRADRFTAQTAGQRIKDAGKVGSDNVMKGTETLLKDIKDALTPKDSK